MVKTKQKYDPFGSNNTTICGDCGIVLTDKSGRIQDAFIYKGVRCFDCAKKAYPEEFNNAEVIQG